MKSSVYYFSATGNSLYVAKELSAAVGADLIPVASAHNSGGTAVFAGSIGIVFPVYYNRIPVIIEEFLMKAAFSSEQYIYFLCTYGGAPGDSLKQVSSILSGRGIGLSAAFGVHMPQNAFSKPWEDAGRISSKAVKKIARIAVRISNRKKGMLPSDRILTAVFRPMGKIVDAPTKKALAGISGLPADTDLKMLIYNADKGYSVSDICSGCGICARVCPVDNIEMVNERPSWLNHCENCTACYNWCPSGAVRSEIVHRGFHYRHPEISLGEIIGQKDPV